MILGAGKGIPKPEPQGYRIKKADTLAFLKNRDSPSQGICQRLFESTQ